MGVTPRKPRARARRSNEDRSAETQARLLEATVDCLNKVGYAGSTTILVSDTSGVTRGGMLHHFPSKVDLMIATAEYCVTKMRELRRARNPDTLQTVSILDVERGRYGVALTEIMLGSRSDPALAERFKPVGDMMLEAQRRAATNIAAREGVKNTKELEPLVWLTMGAIRGITLMELAGVDPGHTETALRHLGRSFDAAVDRIRKKEAGQA